MTRFPRAITQPHTPLASRMSLSRGSCLESLSLEERIQLHKFLTLSQ